MKFKKLSKTARAPTKGSEKAAGWDLYADINSEQPHRVLTDGLLTVEPGETVMVHTGIAIRPDPGYFGAVYARSGLAVREGLRPVNCVGVIDEDYTGEILVCLRNDSKETRVIVNGERIAQIVFQQYATGELVEVEELDKTKRGANGFGSTGI